MERQSNPISLNVVSVRKPGPSSRRLALGNQYLGDQLTSGSPAGGSQREERSHVAEVCMLGSWGREAPSHESGNAPRNSVPRCLVLSSHEIPFGEWRRGRSPCSGLEEVLEPP